jgi:hypothetical protein
MGLVVNCGGDSENGTVIQDSEAWESAWEWVTEEGLIGNSGSGVS